MVVTGLEHSIVHVSQGAVSVLNGDQTTSVYAGPVRIRTRKRMGNFSLPFQLCQLCLQVTFILSIRLSSNIINTSHQHMPAMVQWPFSLGIVSRLTLKSTRHVSFEGSARLVGGSMWRPRPVFNA